MTLPPTFISSAEKLKKYQKQVENNRRFVTGVLGIFYSSSHLGDEYRRLEHSGAGNDSVTDVVVVGLQDHRKNGWAPQVVD